MAGNLSVYHQDNFCSWFKGTTYPAAPAQVWAALFTTAPSQANAGGVEVSGTGYARQSVATAAWNAPTGTTSQPYQIATNTTVDYGTAGSAWGTAVAMGFYDASSGGNLLHIETFGSSVVITSGLPVKFLAGAVTITVSSTTISKYLALAYLNWYRGTAFPAAPTNVYAALFLTVPAQDNSGGTEVSGTGYARQAIAASGGWSALTGTDPVTITNAAQLNWGSAGSAWGTVNGEGLFDASSAGNLLILYTYGSGQAVNSGAAVTQAIGNVLASAD